MYNQNQYSHAILEQTEDVVSKAILRIITCIYESETWVCIFIELFPKSLKSHQVVAPNKSTYRRNQQQQNIIEKVPVTKLKNSKSKEAYMYVKFHWDSSIRNIPKWGDGCGTCSPIISNNNCYFVSEYVNFTLFVKYSISSWL